MASHTFPWAVGGGGVTFASGLGVVGGLGGGGRGVLIPALRLVCGVAGAELVLVGTGGGGGLEDGRGFWPEAARAGPLMDGSETLLVKGGSWLAATPSGKALEELWSEEEERDSVLRAGDGEGELGSEGRRAGETEQSNEEGQRMQERIEYEDKAMKGRERHIHINIDLQIQNSYRMALKLNL